MTIDIRPLRATDTVTVAGMMRRLASYHGDKTPITAKDFERICCGSRKLGYAWVAFDGVKPAGFAVTYDYMDFRNVKRVCRLELLFVEEKLRRRGIGKKLVGKVVREALDRGCVRFSVVVSKKNPLARDFYRKAGMLQAGAGYVSFSAEGNVLYRLSDFGKIPNAKTKVDKLIRE